MTNFFKYLFIVILFVGFTSCEDELQLPDNVIEFESNQLGFSSLESELTININFSRESAEAGNIEVTATLTGLEYGVQFTTEPAMEAGKITIPVVAGATSASFKIIKAEGFGLVGDETIKFTITSSVDALVLGENAELTLSFAEIVAALGSFEPNVGGDLQPNKVFVDLSGSRQYFLSRSDWDLGFYAADDKFVVILNSSTGMMARALNKNSLNDVTASDTTGFGQQLSLAAVFAAVMGPPPGWISETINWIDDPAGNLDATAIDAVSATDSDNKVYIVNRGKNADGSERGWKKVRIIRNGNGYTVQHANISATSFESINVAKDDDYVFNYVHFTNGLVEAEPKKEAWDIAFTVFTNSFPLDASTFIPFEFKDFVIQNRSTSTLQIMTSTKSFESFAESDLIGLTLSTSQKGIGSSWRSIPSNSSTPPSVNSDRFYIVKDGANNYYKIKFTALTKSGERGHPAFNFELVKKGN